MSSRRSKKHVEEEHENHERWLVSYADMITVLMALFIVLYAMSQVDETKFLQLKQSLAAGFGSPIDMAGQPHILSGSGSSPMDAIAPTAMTAQLTAERMPPTDAASQAAQQATAAEVTRALARQRQMQYAEAQAEARRLEEVAAEIRAALKERGLLGDVRTTIDDRGLVVSLVSKHVVFQADLADLSPRGERVVDTLAPVLRGLEEPLQVDGHTNQVPVKPKYFDSDWDLSAARAITVLRRLNEVGGVPADRLAASAYGTERPLVDPAVPGSQKVNKRVDVVVLSSLASGSRELLDEAAAARITGVATSRNRPRSAPGAARTPQEEP